MSDSRLSVRAAQSRGPKGQKSWKTQLLLQNCFLIQCKREMRAFIHFSASSVLAYEDCFLINAQTQWNTIKKTTKLAKVGIGKLRDWRQIDLRINTKTKHTAKLSVLKLTGHNNAVS